MTTTPSGTSTGERPTRGTADPQERRAWIALAGVRGLGARRLTALVRRFGSAQAVFHADPMELAGVEGIAAAGARRILRHGPSMRRGPSGSLRGQHLLIPPDPGYPPRLRTIPDPPSLLYCRGDLTLLHADAVAIIGSRNHSHYGARMARRLGESAVAAGLVVVSGMARGLDAVAQASALDAGGVTIGVLGTGADVVYPRQNRPLFDRVLADGLLVTESPPGAQPIPGAFPRRNRIISGLASALVVVEATEGSGTLITVGAALEQGREVFAVPGPIDVPTSRGTNRLIRDGATPLLDPDELPALLGLQATDASRPVDAPAPTLTPDEARVHGGLSHDPVHIDALALAVGLPMGTLLGTLLGLELGGLVEQLPGSHFRKR